MRWYFGFFFVSGFCSILYELVWLRLSMAQFGVTTALVSIVLSAFMAGLGLGSWASGELLRLYGNDIRFPVLRLYALIELFIATAALLVPLQLQWGHNLLEGIGVSSSVGYYFASGAWIILTLVPWCSLMGATIPVAMLAIRRTFRQESPRSFSYLYTANLFGAILGAGLPLVLIEILGFHGSLKIGSALNALMAVSAMALTLRRTSPESSPTAATAGASTVSSASSEGKETLTLLFTTGLTAMGMEVVWIRQFTPYLGTVVYAFALILAIYLSATFVGAKLYRKRSLDYQREPALMWSLLGLAALFPLATADPRMHLVPVLRLLFGIGPFTGMLGFLTPMLVDRWSKGDSARAGTAYAVNVVGCILGPLIAGFLLLPHMSERWAVLVLSLPWLAYDIQRRWSSPAPENPQPPLVRVTPYLILALVLVFVSLSADYDAHFSERKVLRDETATIIGTGTGMQKRLLVNGVGITALTPVTKMMAHMPLAYLDHPPHDALAICFGMGTTYRSLMSWDIHVTAVELVRSVPAMFGYFHADGPQLLTSPLSQVVADDGRRYLERIPLQYDVITIDPPPPVKAAGSSMLYSAEFYAIAKRRLRAGGILQQWLPGGDSADVASIALTLKKSFAYVRVFPSVEHWGVHFLASDTPIRDHTPEELVKAMPSRALTDLMEWGPAPDAEHQFATVLADEIPLDKLIAAAPGIAILRDDRPINEYYLLRKSLPKKWQHFAWQERSVN